MNTVFYLNSILLGIGLAMDAFSVSMANGLTEPRMSRKRMCVIAGCYAFFQYLMPLAGWFFVHTILEMFRSFERLIPWIGFILLVYIGGKMLWESREDKEEDETATRITGSMLLLQGIATSIDALSVGFTIAEYPLFYANIRCLLIAAVTFCICIGGLKIGKRAGDFLKSRALVLGGVILILIGAEILIKSLFFS